MIPLNAMIDAILSKHPKHRYMIGGLLSPPLLRSIIRHNLLPTWLSDIIMIKDHQALGKPAVLKETKKDH